MLLKHGAFVFPRKEGNRTSQCLAFFVVFGSVHFYWGSATNHTKSRDDKIQLLISVLEPLGTQGYPHAI